MTFKVDAKPLPPAIVTFRVHKPASGPAHLIPMVDGVDIPNFVGAVIQQQVGGSAVAVMTSNLPNGIVVE